MNKLISVLLIIHIIAGATALLCGLLAILFRKKVLIHKRVGKVYFYSMTVVFITAISISVMKGNVFLFCVAVFTYYACLTAYRSLRLKKLHLDQNPAWYDWLIEAVFGTIHLGFVIFALLVINKNPTFGTISLVFGLIGVRLNISTIFRLKRKKLVYKNYWLLAHIGGMLGSYIGTITAFVVNNSRLIPLPPIVLWLGPTVIIVPLIAYEIKQHQKKGGKLVQKPL
ncbi:MAG: hypothetical protein IPM51_05675 [Sphingobacteriaceae bacterium]|nr:hypothetical protein [Sphingobacteriaceae bacterium]